MQPAFSLSGKKIWVAGHRGMVGSALCRKLKSEDCELITVTRDIVDLSRQSIVEEWMAEQKIDAVFLAAATVGGILNNDTYPANFIYDNLAIQTNVIHASHLTGVSKLVFMGSSCIYPKFANQPITEDSLLTGSLEPTNQWYAIAKIAGIKQIQAYRRQYNSDFISVMPTNLYGIGDNFHLEKSHVIPALMRKAHTAKINNDDHMMIWGTGNARREFLYVDDLAEATLFLAKNYSDEQHINVGVGKDQSITELCKLICKVVGFDGELKFDTSKPDGTPQKLLDVEKINSIGWTASTSLEDGLASTYEWYLQNIKDIRK